MSEPKPVNDNLCPLCCQENACQVGASQACWCMQAEIPAQLIEKVPKELQGKSCICQQCLRAFVDKGK